MNEYKDYKLNYYPKCEEYPMHDNRYQTFKARPYDDAEYYWAYTYDKENWKVVEEHNEAIKKTRKYKQKLYKEGKLKEK